MTDFYNALKSRIRGTVASKKTDSLPVARLSGADALRITREMERLERIVADRIGRLKQGVQSGEALVSQETRQAEQLASDLRAEVAGLQSKLKEAEEHIERKEGSYRQMEEALSGKIKTLESEIKRKDELLAIRDNDIRHQKSKIDVHVKKIGELELAHRKTREELASQAKRAEEFGRASQEKLLALEAELQEAKTLDGQRSSTLKRLEEQLATQTQEFENALKGSQELVASRDAQITELKSHLQRLLKSIDEMSALFRQAQALTGGKEQQGAPVPNETLSEAEASAATVQSEADEAKPVEPDAIVAPEIFQRIVQELAQASNIMKQLASLIVHDHVKALGETMEQFPQARLPELIEALAKDISDQNLQTDFRRRLADRTEMTLH